MSARRVLVVTYPYPPMPSVGAGRWLAMTRYLRRLGHEVTVLTSSSFGGLPDDGAQDVIRTADLLAAPPLRRAFHRPPLPVGGAGAPGDAPDTPAPAVFTRVLVPDGYLATWVPFALAAAHRLVRERGIDCIVTTTPYESAHLVGLALRRRVAWIADFRDGWTFESHRLAFPTRFQHALDLRLERAVVTGAGAVLAATLPIAEDFRRRLGVDALHVPNAWDPELAAEADAVEPFAPDLGRVSIVHPGTLSGVRGRDPGPLLLALRRLREQEPELAGRLRLVLAGRLTGDQERLLAAADLGDQVRHEGLLGRAGSLRLQRDAGALLLLTSSDVSEATGKLFEYLGAGRPILALAQGNEAARIVRETGTGRVVAPDDVEAIMGGLRAVADGTLEREYAPHGLEAYRYPAPAEAVAGEIERVLAARGRSATA